MFKLLTVVAHRGYSSEAPENTIAAFDLALRYGYSDIEFDVQLSKDGVPMVLHDELLGRTTNGLGRLDGYTYAQLKQLDAGSWFNPKFGEQRIPSLLELLARYKSKARLHIELKSTEFELAERVVQALDVSGWLQADTLIERVMSRQPKLVISSFKRTQLERSIKLLPNVAHELLVETITEESMLWASRNGIRSYHPDGKDITPEFVARAHELNLHVGAWWWTRRDQDTQQIATYGVRYAFVDEPKAHQRRLIKRPYSS
ncbi:hypothetical protein H7171_03530 [Candidatus Saccharibacteria bacterium]|nr:hypothetical protein [Candidatus Saccharibacteria bacterium]